MLVLPERLARIERVADGFTNEDQEREHDRQSEKAGQTEPGRLSMFLALKQ